MADQKLSTRDLTNAQTTTDDSEDNPTPNSGMTATDEPLARDPAGGVEPAEDRTSSASQVDRQPLLPADQSLRFTERWQEIQASFVDRPRESVAEADTLVADLMQRLAASFSNERDELESQWDRGDDVSTEDLRVALTRYRSFFDRLLAA